MKIKVKDLEPNPFRKMEHYPIDKAKVKALKTSIREKTFWDNILVRKRNGRYQLAYGHHRWIALKELGIKEIDVPVRDIDNTTMIQIMAEENLNWSTSPAVMIQTILAVKKFLDAELAKYETWKEFRAGDFASPIFNSEPEFRSAKGQGVGRDTLVKFLGKNWTDFKVRVALDIIKDKDLDKKAIETIPTMGQARRFRESVKKYNIPKATQKRIAKQIVKEEIGKRDIPDLVAEHASPKSKKAVQKSEFKSINFDTYFSETERIAVSLTYKLEMITGTIEKHPKIILPPTETTKLLSALRMLGIEIAGLFKALPKSKTNKPKEAKRKTIKGRTL